MSQHTTYIVGWITLAPAAVAAVSIIYRMVAPQWRRIWSLACGNPESLRPVATLTLRQARPAILIAAPRGLPGTPAHDAGCTGARTRRA